MVANWGTSERPANDYLKVPNVELLQQFASLRAMPNVFEIGGRNPASLVAQNLLP